MFSNWHRQERLLPTHLKNQFSKFQMKTNVALSTSTTLQAMWLLLRVMILLLSSLSLSLSLSFSFFFQVEEKIIFYFEPFWLSNKAAAEQKQQSIRVKSFINFFSDNTNLYLFFQHAKPRFRHRYMEATTWSKPLHRSFSLEPTWVQCQSHMVDKFINWSQRAMIPYLGNPVRSFSTWGNQAADGIAQLNVSIFKVSLGSLVVVCIHIERACSCR